MKLAIIGCGNLGSSILNGLMHSDLKGLEITATRRDVTSLSHFQEKGIEVTSDNIAALEGKEIIIFGLKPYNLLQELELLKSNGLKNKIIVSLVSGRPLSEIESVVDPSNSVFRAMPNTAAEFNESITCISTNCEDESALAKVEQLFEALGETVRIDESLMNAATVLGASGIAFSLRFIRAMVQSGIQLGFSTAQANIIARQVVKGSAELLKHNGSHPEAEIDKVTTPQGCTIAGLNEMEHNGFSSALIKGTLESLKTLG